MSFNNVIPADILSSIARDIGVMIQVELPLDTPIWVFVDPEDLTSTKVSLNHYNPSGAPFGSLSHIDHPSFSKTRDFLEENNYIKTERSYSNGDRVLKPFYFNNVLMVEGDQFLCACAMKTHYSSLYNNGKILEEVKNYREYPDNPWEP